MAKNIKDNKDNKNEIDENLKEIINHLNDNELSKEEIKKLLEETKDSIDFLKKLDEIDLKMDKYVVFTDGNEQLIYEDGEFFVVSTIEHSRDKKKKKRSEAKDMYLEYFIKYQLNPYIDKSNKIKPDLNIEKLNTVKSQAKHKKQDILVEEKKEKEKIDDETLSKKLETLKKKEKEIKENSRIKQESIKKEQEKDDIIR